MKDKMKAKAEERNLAYENYRATVRREAEKTKRLLEVSQSALWAKAIATEAYAGKHDGLETFTAGGKFGFTEPLVNQCIEYAMRAYSGGYAQDEIERKAWQLGYEYARREFAKATGLYKEDDYNA